MSVTILARAEYSVHTNVHNLLMQCDPVAPQWWFLRCLAVYLYRLRGPRRGARGDYNRRHGSRDRHFFSGDSRDERRQFAAESWQRVDESITSLEVC